VCQVSLVKKITISRCFPFSWLNADDADASTADKRKNPRVSAFAAGDPFYPRSNIASQMKIFVFIVFFVVNFFNHRGHKVHKEYHKENLCVL